jgi:hypothetical protein
VIVMLHKGFLVAITQCLHVMMGSFAVFCLFLRDHDADPEFVFPSDGAEVGRSGRRGPLSKRRYLDG